jgi:hypothetical protein
LISHTAIRIQSIAGVLIGVQVGKNIARDLVADARRDEEHIDGRSIVDGAETREGEVVQQLAFGGFDGVGLAQAAEGGQGDRGKRADKRDDDEQFDQAEAGAAARGTGWKDKGWSAVVTSLRITNATLKLVLHGRRVE